jgi:predicted MFS family arabinose efflux permease
LINEHWLTKAGAGYLGMINFVGYLLGAFLGQHINKYYSSSIIIRLSLVISIIGLALCAFHWNFAWLAIWRFSVGLSGALLIVLTPSFVFKNVSESYRSRASGVIFTGVGFAIIISGFIFPQIATFSLPAAWLSTALCILIASAIAWRAFSIPTNHRLTSALTITTVLQHKRILALLALAYTFYAIGFTPHSLFLVDYIHRQLHLSEIASGYFWTLYGIGALIGPFVSGFFADKFGLYKALLGSYFIGIFGIAIILLPPNITLYLLSSFIMGAIIMAIATLTSARIAELVGNDPHPQVWGRFTLYLGLGQTLGTYGMSYLLHLGFDYFICFAIANIAFLLGFIASCFAKNGRT